MALHQFDPLTDRRWSTFLDEHPDASIFHTAAWLSVLKQSYGYDPIAFTTTPTGALSNAVVFCKVRSWLTGSRLVSLPFSDHCQPLASEAELSEILQCLHDRRLDRRQRYIELRPRSGNSAFGDQQWFTKSEVFSQQAIDLRPELSVLYGRLHSSCIRRKIKRADREGLLYESGRSEDLLRKFRSLLLLTRRRHKLPPQPACWFSNIVSSLREQVTIHILSQGSIPIASILTLRFKKTLVYKYGCSDAQFNAFGATPSLFWQVIQQARNEGCESFDLGRSACDDAGLTTFKEHLGAVSSELTYFRDPASLEVDVSPRFNAASFARSAVVHLPDPLFAGVGQLLYRHLG